MRLRKNRTGRKFLSAALVLALLTSLFPSGTALGFISTRNYGWTLGLWNPKTEKVEPANTSKIYWNSMWCYTVGPWDVRLNGSTVGTIIQFVDTQRVKDNGYPMVGEPQWDAWIALANGNRDYVRQALTKYRLRAGDNNYYNFANFVQLIELCGGRGGTYDVANHYMTIYTSVPPYVTLLADKTQVNVGDTVTFTLKAQTNTYWNQYIDLSFAGAGKTYINSQRYYTKHLETTYKVKMEREGTFEFRLLARDSVWRSTAKSIYIAVGSNQPPPPPPEDDGGDYEPPPPPPNQPPDAYFTWPSEAYEGEQVTVTDRSSDPDGTIVSRKWTILPTTAGVTQNLGSSGGTVTFNVYGEYTLRLTVTDDDGAQDSYSRSIFIKQPIPWAILDISGTLKENRKVIIDWSRSGSPALYPLDPARDELVIEPVSGGTASDIKLGTRTDRVQEVLFKQPGTYRVKVRVYNAKYASAWAVEDIVIAPDDPPVANFTPSVYVLRDPADSVAGSAYATIKLTDRSYSPDGDTITQRVWKYRFDSNNDGSFLDETWTVLDSGNNVAPVLKTSKVGKYLFELEVKEGFGQPTLQQFVTDADYRWGDTTTKPVSTKISEVINSPPNTSFTASLPELADIFVSVELGDLSSTINVDDKINRLVLPKILAKNVDAKVTKYDHFATVCSAVERQFNPDINGNLIAWEDERNDRNYEIFMYNMDTKQETQITSGSNDNHYPHFWGNFLYYVEVSSSYPFTYKLYQYNLINKTKKVLYTSSKQIYDFDVYENKIVFDTWENNVNVIYLLDTNTSQCTKIINDGYSPKIWGNKIAYLSGRGYPANDWWETDVYLYDLTTKQDRLISKQPYWVESMDFHENKIIYSDFRNDGRVDPDGSAFYGTTDVYLYDLAANTEHVLSAIPGLDEHEVAVWGNYAAWVEGHGKVMLYNIDSGKKAAIGTNFKYSGSPSIRDGKLAWDATTNSATSYDIYYYDANNALNYATWRPNAKKFFVTLRNEPLIDYVTGLYTKTFANKALGSSFTGNYGVTGGNKADGGSGTVDAYYYAKNRYIDIGTMLPKQYLSSITFTANTGGGDGTGGEVFRSIQCYVSQDGATWFPVGSLTANQFNFGSLTVSAGSLPIDNIRYFRAYNDFCIDHFQVTISSNGNMQFNTFVESLVANNINYTILGSALNKTDAENIINANSNNGLFIDGGYSDSAFDRLGTYIADQFTGTTGPSVKYVLLGQSIALQAFYSDYENDPKYADNWYYVHDPDYVDNNSGYSFYHNKVLSSPVSLFDKVGKYDITYKAQDNPVNGDLRFLDYMLWSNPVPTSIIVHRKPVADFTVQPGTLNITDLSYDPDFQYKRPDKGIVEWEWKWKPTSSGTWTLGSPNGITAPGTYDVYLRVQDCYGVWSDPVIKTITVTDPNRPPVAAFTWTPAVIYEGDDVTLTNRSYDPDGDPITYQWTVFDPQGVTRTYTTKNVTLSSVLPGTWWVTLRVWDNHGSTGVVTKSFVVNRLGINGYVQHTPDWNKNRIAYNQYHTGTDNLPRGYNVFWAGERFVLTAATTDTGSSATKAVSVTATLLNSGISTALTSADRVNWTGSMWQPDFEQLPDGTYTFRFRVTYSNGVVKTDDAAIIISGSWQDYFRYHRSQ